MSLSRRQATPALILLALLARPSPARAQLSLADYQKLRINEIIASNGSVDPRAWDCQTTDMLELFNGSDEELVLDHPEIGHVRITDNSTFDLPGGGEGAKRYLSFRNHAVSRLAPGGRLLIFCDEFPEPIPLCRSEGYPLSAEVHAPFRLDLDGETITLELVPPGDGDAIVLHEVSYPPLPRNVSYGRYPETIGDDEPWVFHQKSGSSFGQCQATAPEGFTTCGGAGNGPGQPIRPEAELIDFSDARPAPGEPVTVRARVLDEKTPGPENFESVSIRYTSSREPAVEQVVPMSFLALVETPVQDEPRDGNGEPLFRRHKWSIWEGTIPPQNGGTEVDLQIEVRDVDGFVGYGTHAYRIHVGDTAPDPVRINEVVADQRSILEDLTDQDRGCPEETPDCGWDDFIEITNPSVDAVDLGGMTLSAHPLLAGIWSFPDQTMLEPGDHLLVWIDPDSLDPNRPDAHGRFHAPYILGSDLERFHFEGEVGRTPPPPTTWNDPRGLLDGARGGIFLFDREGHLVDGVSWGGPSKRYLTEEGGVPVIEPLERGGVSNVVQGLDTDEALARVPDGTGPWVIVRDDAVTPGGSNPTTPPGHPFQRGNVNADDLLDITDPVANLDYQFLGSFEPPCLDACDFDDNGLIEITDPIASLHHQFLGGPAPPPPGEATCGSDPTGDPLSCVSFPPCSANP